MVEPLPGDIVIDAGIGWGDTTCYIASKVAYPGNGFVYSFDICETGIKMLNKQLGKNPQIKNVAPNLLALSDKSGQKVKITQESVGAKVLDADNSPSSSLSVVETITIDDFKLRENIGKINFIKMDIEGSETRAILGASKTIRDDSPTLAISVYHDAQDLCDIPLLINSINPNYRYFLNCTTGFGGEVVLFCVT